MTAADERWGTRKKDVPRPAYIHLDSTYPSHVHSLGSGNHSFQTFGDDGEDSPLGLGEAPVRLSELHRPTIVHVLQVL